MENAGEIPESQISFFPLHVRLLSDRVANVIEL